MLKNLFVPITCTLLSGLITQAADFSVSPDGGVAALERARDAARAIDTPVTVELAAGRYAFSKTLVLGPQDGGITFRAAPGAEVIFDGGLPVAGWEKSELPGNIWVAKIPTDGTAPRTLYCGETRLQRARGKGFSPRKQYDSWTGPNTDTIEFPPGALKNYADLKHAEIVARTSAAWAMNILPLLSVDEAAGIAKTAPCNYSLGRKRHRPVAPDDMWVENVLAELDAPGEWAVHPDEGKLYYWPLEGDRPENIFAPAVSEIVRVEGQIDYDGPQDTPVRGIGFEGITFVHGDRVAPPQDIQGDGLQHGWDTFDYPNAMLRFRGAEDCSVKNCRFTAGGDNGIRLDLHAQNITIENSLFNHLGGAAAVFSGYGLGTKDANKNNAFINNHVYRVCELKKDRPALLIWQSGGNRIANNLIHDVPYTALSVSCRAAITGAGEANKSRRDSEITGSFFGASTYEGWKSRERFWHGRNNAVESNEFFSVMQFMDDGDAIYITGTAGGNIVRRNYIHDSWLPNIGSAIRCDDDQHETLVAENLITDIAGRACGIVNKGKNDLINNICINLYQNAQHHFGMIAFMSYKPDGCTVERNILYCPEPTRVSPVTAGKTRPHVGDEQIELKNSQLRNNLYWSPIQPVWAADYLTAAQTNGFELGSLVADPQFVNVRGRDYNFMPGSPALKLGIVPVTPDGTGPDYSRWSSGPAEKSKAAKAAFLEKAQQAGAGVTGDSRKKNKAPEHDARADG